MAHRFIGILLLLLPMNVFAGEESAWNVLQEAKPLKDGLRLVFVSHQGEAFKGCPKLTIDIKRYSVFKWSFLALISGSSKPERKESIELLSEKLNKLVGKPMYIAERTPLERISDCHFSSDGAVLENNFLYLYFKLYRK